MNPQSSGALHSPRRRSPRRWLRYAMFMLISSLLLLAASVSLPASTNAQDALPKPENISCQGFERDTVLVYWTDTATDETNYRVERSVDGGAFSEIATVSPDSNGNYPAYRDESVDVTQNLRYRVRSYRDSDTSFSPFTDDLCSNPQIAETANYRIFYHVDGVDSCPTPHGKPDCLANDTNTNGENVYVERLKQVLEGSAAGMTRIGFSESPTDQIGSVDKVPVHVGNGGGATAYLSGRGIWMRVSTEDVLERSFDLNTRVGVGTPWTVPTHEMQHLTQYQYGLPLEDPARNWVYEGHANLVMDKVCVGDDRATCEDFDDVTNDPYGYFGWTRDYLGNTNRPVIESSYAAVHFWTYMTEKYGTANLNDPVENGMDLLPEFWQEARDNSGRDGVAVLDSTLANLGHSERFRDIWKDFAVASYAKDLTGPNVPDIYLYDDVSQPGGNFGGPSMALDRSLALGDQAVDTDETVTAWGANYYEVRPAADVSILDIEFTQETGVPLYYTILGIDNDDIVYEYNVEAVHLEQTLLNEGYDAVVVVVAGLENLANYRYSFNGTLPTLTIREPTTGNKARVGDPAAPDKFRVVVEIVAPDGTPFPNVDLDNFTFTVGTETVPAAQVLTAAIVQNQQWFVLRAPTQTSSGSYDLTVEYGTALSDTQSSAVRYVERDDIDNVLIVDRSGSMADSSKLEAAQAAARLYVDSWRTGDQVGVIGFNDNVPSPINLTLRPWTTTSRDAAISEINSLTATGGTAIGDALRSGWDELDNRGDTNHDWAMILLSDGLETAGTEEFDDLIRELDEATGKHPVVHTVAVGPDADRLRMQRLASKTGGTYHAVSVPTPIAAQAVGDSGNLLLDMNARYRAIATEVDGQEQFYSLLGPVGSPNQIEDANTIPVESGAPEMIVSLSWEATAFMNPPQLFPPGEYPFGNAQTPTQTYVSGDERHYVWQVSTPQAGDWTLYLNAVINRQAEQAAPQQTKSVLPPYVVQASLRSEVAMDVYLTTPEEERDPGEPMGIVASLTDNAPVTGATINAAVTAPDNSLYAVPLLDDGNHDDGEANDGLYGGTFYQTGQPGSYNVQVRADGTAPTSGVFVREKLLSFFISGISGRANDPPNPDPNEPEPDDRDGDGLPDAWEEEYGTDPDVPDADQDPDYDGWDNQKELEEGTDPNDPDSDNDGEADSTDDDPRNPDLPNLPRLDPPRAVVYPGDGEIIIRYTPRPGADQYGVFWGPSPDGPFTFLGLLDPAQGEDTISGLTNGQDYCFFVAVIVNGRRSISSDPTCATPGADYTPPTGSIIINDGADTTSSPNVVLSLYASDTVDPRLVPDADNMPREDTATGVTEMMISNSADMSSGVWEPYATSKNWTLAQQSGIAAVFVKYRDGAGNETVVYPATIEVSGGVYLPFVTK